MKYKLISIYIIIMKYKIISIYNNNEI